MKMRRPRSTNRSGTEPNQPDSLQPSNPRPAVSAWYATTIAGLLLIAAGAYIVYLHQQRLRWQESASQMSIGQDLLRDDRDVLLRRTREHETEMAELEQQLSQGEARHAALEGQRNDLQHEVARLTQDLTIRERKSGNDAQADVHLDQRRTLERQRDRLAQNTDRQKVAIEQQAAEISRLKASLREHDQALYRSRVNERDQETLATKARVQKAALAEKVGYLWEKLRNMQSAVRLRQIVQGHRASLGESKLYLADVDAADWQAIEDWIERQLKRPMALPKLASYGWSCEGARVLGTAVGSPAAMLLYVDAEESPISFTIAQAPSASERIAEGQDVLERREAGLNLLEWHDAQHIFVLAGEADMVA